MLNYITTEIVHVYPKTMTLYDDQMDYVWLVRVALSTFTKQELVFQKEEHCIMYLKIGLDVLFFSYHLHSFSSLRGHSNTAWKKSNFVSQKKSFYVMSNPQSLLLPSDAMHALPGCPAGYMRMKHYYIQNVIKKTNVILDQIIHPQLSCS